MVSYQKWTSLVFEQVPEEVTANPEQVQNIISIAAEIWQERKTELNTATISEARNIARQEIEVEA